jgi:hypothetical protein
LAASEAARRAFVCAFAALFPLGGMIFLRVSGLPCVREAGAGRIDQDAEVVFEAAPVCAQKLAALRAQIPSEVSAQVDEPRPPAISKGRRTEH